MLYHVFPQIKAFGNCHEVFFVQMILARALKEETALDVKHSSIQINPLGINHFTWIDYATYQDIDIFPIYRRFALKYKEVGLHGDDCIYVGPFGSAEKVKLDLFLKHGIIAAAGDRHLVEFLPKEEYIQNPEMVAKWRYYLTPVSLRKDLQEKRSQEIKRLISSNDVIPIQPSREDGIAQIKALACGESFITNVNIPNRGQISNLELGSVVETNAHFRFDQVAPIYAGALPAFPLEITKIHQQIHQLLLRAFDQRDLSYARQAFHLDPLIQSLSNDQLDQLFSELIPLMSPYLENYQNQS